MIVLYILAAVVALLAAWRVALVIWQKTADVYHYCQNLKLDRQGRAQALKEPARIPPDPVTGSYPLLQEPGGGRVLDVDRGLLFDRDGLLNASPQVHLWAARRRIIASLHVNLSGAGGGDPVGGLLQEPEQPLQWPKVVDLRGQFAGREPTLDDLVVGVYPGERGLEKLSASLHDLMHVLAVGASGWGKSSWLRSLLWQLALAREPVEVVAIDVSGSEFNPLRNWQKLRYPVARESQEAAALLEATSEEITRRKGLYEVFPLVTKLTEYNDLVSKPLSPWVILIDEGTSLLNDSNVGDRLRRGVQQARQYGLYYVVSGQSANHRVIETQTRDQFSTRLCFRTSPTSSRVVLDDGGASSIRDKGRALAQLVGRELCEIQGLYITKNEFVEALAGGGPRFPMPEVGGNGGVNPEMAKRIKALASKGVGLCAICDEVFGYHNAAKTAIVKDVLGLN